jgi:hypothetical protein
LDEIDENDFLGHGEICFGKYYMHAIDDKAA